MCGKDKRMKEQKENYDQWKVILKQEAKKEDKRSVLNQEVESKGEVGGGE